MPEARALQEIAIPLQGVGVEVLDEQRLVEGVVGLGGRRCGRIGHHPVEAPVNLLRAEPSGTKAGRGNQHDDEREADR